MVVEYAVPVVAAGNDRVVMLKLVPVPAGVTATVAEPFAVGSAVLVAVTVTVVRAVTAGAVNNPVLEICPEVADQVTLVMLVSRTEAVNC
jgi:hypothetical protein